jgi:predicted phage-related endonuclease
MSAALLTDVEWHHLRSQVVGGSEVAALFGAQPDYCLSLYGLWMVKAGRVPLPTVSNPRTVWGLKLEAAIAEGCAEQEGWTIRKGSHVVDPVTPGMGCTLDFIIESGEPGKGHGALEIKNVDRLVHARSWQDGEPPMHILLQHQHQMACTGYSWGAVGELIGGNELRIYRYEARPRLIADIRRRVREFWQSIEAGCEPSVDGSDTTTAILRALNLETIDEVADLTADNEAPEICAGLLHATEARKAAEHVENEFKNRLIQKLGPNRKARAQGFFISTAITPEKPARAAEPGEIIAGRKESRRYSVKEMTV